MFASILREITSVFDRRSAVSTFFPTLVFLGGTLLAVLVTIAGIDDAIALWQREPGTIQAVLIVGFLVLVTFLTFVVSSLREWQDRMCQGYWPPWANRITNYFTNRHRCGRQNLIDADDRAQFEEEALTGERHAFPISKDKTVTSLSEQDITGVLQHLKAVLSSPSWPSRTSARLAEVAAAVRHHGSPQHIDELSALLPKLDAHLHTAEQRVRDTRAAIQTELFLRYPQPPLDVLPTRMGNLVRAAEQHPSTRYGLDAVVLWTRLQPLLPKEFTETVKNAKLSADILLTIAAYLVLFGIPLSCWIAWRLPRLAGTPVAWITAIAVVITATAVPRLLALWSRLLALAAATALAVHAIVQFWPGLLRLTSSLVWTAALLVLAHGHYSAATQAMIAYTERLRTAFDLYRWKLLTELRLPLPNNLSEERDTWNRLSQFLYRGGVTTPTHLRYCHPKPDQPIGGSGRLHR